MSSAGRVGGDVRPALPFLLIVLLLVAVFFAYALLDAVADRDFASASSLIALAAVAFGISQFPIMAGRWPGWLSGYSVITLSYVLIFAARPWYTATFEQSSNIFTGGPYRDSALTASLVAAAGYVAVSISYAFVFRSRNRLAPSTIPKVIDSRRWKTISPLLVVVGLAGCALYLAYIAQLGPANYIRITFSGRSEEYWTAVRETSGYLQNGLRFALGVGLFALFQAILRKSFVQIILFTLFVAVLSIPQVFAGSRSAFLPVVFCILLFLSIAAPKVVSGRKLAVIAPTIFILGFVAPRIWRDGLSRNSDIATAIQLALDPQETFSSFLGGLDTAMLDALALQVESQSNGAVPLQYGGTYVAAIVAPVPREIWASKPEVVDQYLNSVIFPVSDAQGTGYAFSMFSEPLVNFGVIGVILFGALFGATIGILHRKAEDIRTLPWMFVYALSGAYAFVIMRGSLSFDIQRLLMLLVPVLLVLWISGLFSSAPDRQR